MARQIKVWEAEDGSCFKTLKEANTHDASLKAHNELCELITEKVENDNHQEMIRDFIKDNSDAILCILQRQANRSSN